MSKKKVESKYTKIKHTILWYLAIILEYINIPLHLAAMGYEFNISIYMKLQRWQYVPILYYVSAGIDIMLFWYFVLLYRKKKELKLMGLSVFCCLIQIILLIYKVKL